MKSSAPSARAPTSIGTNTPLFTASWMKKVGSSVIPRPAIAASLITRPLLARSAAFGRTTCQPWSVEKRQSPSRIE
jgi:hypothetical protein